MKVFCKEGQSHCFECGDTFVLDAIPTTETPEVSITCPSGCRGSWASLNETPEYTVLESLWTPADRCEICGSQVWLSIVGAGLLCRECWLAQEFAPGSGAPVQGKDITWRRIAGDPGHDHGPLGIEGLGYLVAMWEDGSDEWFMDSSVIPREWVDGSGQADEIRGWLAAEGLALSTCGSPLVKGCCCPDVACEHCEHRLNTAYIAREFIVK